MKLTLVGQKFHKLTAINFIPGTRKVKAKWFCICDCGNSTEVRTNQLVSGSVKSCGCYYKESIKVKDYHTRRTLPNSLAAKKSLYNRYKCDSRGYSFNISFETFVELTSCPCRYCGSLPARINKPKHSNAPGYKYNGLDRLDNNLGYEVTNVVPCCYTCNKKKGNMSYDEFVTWLMIVTKRLGIIK